MAIGFKKVAHGYYRAYRVPSTTPYCMPQIPPGAVGLGIEASAVSDMVLALAGNTHVTSIDVLLTRDNILSVAHLMLANTTITSLTLSLWADDSKDVFASRCPAGFPAVMAHVVCMILAAPQLREVHLRHWATADIRNLMMSAQNMRTSHICQLSVTPIWTPRDSGMDELGLRLLHAFPGVRDFLVRDDASPSTRWRPRVDLFPDRPLDYLGRMSVTQESAAAVCAWLETADVQRFGEIDVDAASAEAKAQMTHALTRALRTNPHVVFARIANKLVVRV